jgi:hypothetical protein
MNMEQLCAALMAIDPLICREALAGQEPDEQRIEAVLDVLEEQQPGVCWAVVNVEDHSAILYEGLIEAAENYDSANCFLAACKTEDGKVYLSMDGKWTGFEASVAG